MTDSALPDGPAPSGPLSASPASSPDAAPRYVTEALPHGDHSGPAHRVPLWPAVLFGVLSLVLLVVEMGPRYLALGTLVAVLPVPFYVMLALWLDRFEAEPPRLLALTFTWGATVAFALALLVNSYAQRAVGAALGPLAAEWVGSAVSAPVVEEAAKGVALLLLFHTLEDEFDGVVDGVVYAAMVGLGFAMMENIQFYGHALREGIDSSLEMFVTRGMLSPFAHPFFTAMIGIGLGVVREAHGDARRNLPPLAGLLVAVALHSLWNVAAHSEDLWWTAYLLVMVPAFLGVLLLIYVSLQREGGVIRQHLDPLVAEGLLRPDELECLCNSRLRLRASLEAWWRGGRVQWRERREMHQVASELAFHRWRVGRGLSRGELADAARDAEYLRRLRELCGRSAAVRD